MNRKTAGRLIVAVVSTGGLMWATWRVLVYVPANQETTDRIDVGMTGGEGELIFGRPPFQDSDVTLADSPDIREFLHGGTTTRDWDGPEGLITVVFDKHDRVQNVTFNPADSPVQPGPWIRARFGLWP